MAMMGLQIPKRHERGLIKLRKLDEASFKEFLALSARVGPVFDRYELAAVLKPGINSIPEEDVEDIVETLISLFRVRTSLDLTPSELADSVCEAMTRTANEDLKLGGEECDLFRDRLTRCLAIESFSYPAKVSEVLSDYDNVFVRARVLTDLRAIFGPDPEDSPKGAAIVHLLGISYQHGARGERFFLAMDSQDVESLISTLRRALAKEKGLRKLLDAAEVAHVDPE
jgi:hypothetical protein